MNILLDTHIAIWALLNSPKLTQKSRDLLEDPDNTFYYSVVSVWEVMLKKTAHPENMDLSADMFSDYCKKAGFVPLRLEEKHIFALRSFPSAVEGHKDPFDRVLLAQAKTERLYLLTNDSKLPLYQETCVISQ